jgi:transposase
MGMAPKEVAAVSPPPLRLSALENPHRKDLGLVQVAMRHTPSRWLFQRYQAVALVLQGYPYSAVSQIIGRSLATISHYIQAYRRGGLAALAPRHSSGRPHHLTAEQEHTVAEIVTHQTPQDVDFPAEMNWTAPLVRRLIKDRFGVTFSERGVRHLLYRLGFACTRPTYTLAKADPEKQAAFRETFEKQRQRLLQGDIDHILFEDESMIRDYQAIGRTWFPKGQQKVIPTYGKHWGDKLLGILDYESGEILCRHATQYDAKEFLDFLQEIVAHYPGERLVLILDNARIHHAKLIQPFLADHRETLTLLFLPPYSPKLNPIEGLWGWLKSSVIYHVFFKSVKAIIAAVDTFLATISQDPMTIIDRLCVRI